MSKKIHYFDYKHDSSISKCMNFKDFTVYTWDFAQFALAHEYLVTSFVFQYSGSGGVVSKVLAH